MKRISALLALVVFSACATTAAPTGAHRIKAFAAPQANVDTNQLVVYKGTPPAPAAGTVAIISNDGAALLQQNSDGTTSTLGGGSGTVTADAPLTGTGSSGSHLGLRASTTSLSGSMSAADKTKIDGLASGSWFDTEALWLSTVCTWATEYSAVKVGQVPVGRANTSTNDSLVEGGGMSPAASIVAYTGSVFQAPKTGKVCLEFRAKLTVPSAAHVSELGINNNAGAHSVWMGVFQSFDATHLTLNLTGGATTSIASTWTVDALWHNFAMTFDGTTYTVYVDHVSVVTQTTLTNVADEAMAIFQYSSSANLSIVSKIIYGYVTQ